MKKSNTKEFVEKINQKYPNEYDILGEYRDSHSPISVRHKKCNYVWNVTPTNMLSKKDGIICPCCNHNTVIEGINDLWTTNIELALCLVDESIAHKYSRNSKEKVDWICPYCGEKIMNRRIVDSYYYGVICKRCSRQKSMPNRIMFNLLSQLQIPFEDEKVFDWCKYYYEHTWHSGRYDFYFIYNSRKYIVEMDGGFHTKDNIMSGLSYQQIKDIDNFKDILANENGIDVIRIDCSRHNIINIKKRILDSKLSSILDLSFVNWENIFYHSCDNRIKECCELYNNGKTITDIQNYMNLSYPSVRRFLDAGVEGGICDYRVNKRQRSVICLNTLQVFKNQTEASKAYNAPRSGIDNSCKDRNKSGGKHPITNEKLYWMFFDEYEKRIKGGDYNRIFTTSQNSAGNQNDRRCCC